MKISRRELLTSTASCLLIGKPVLASNEKNTGDNEWEITCKKWMQVLIPDDDFGAGVDSVKTWQRIYQVMGESKKTSSKLIKGFGLLQQQTFPENTQQLNAILQQQTDTGRFLKYFFDLLIEIYYGAEAGWKDIGLDSPPQPKGFIVSMQKIT